MDLSISTGASAQQLGTNVLTAVQSMTLDNMRQQGAQLAAMIQSAGQPVGSTNLPTQGNFVDAFA